MATLEGRNSLKGVLLILAAGLCWSSGGPLMRAIEAATPWQILFYRSSGMLAVVGLFCWWELRGDLLTAFRRLGWWGLQAGLFIAGAFSLFIVSMGLTTVANSLFSIACSPLFAAVLGGLVLKETVRRATWFAMGLAAIGITIMVWDGIDGGGLWGNLAALTGAFCFACFTLTLRRFELRGERVDLRPTLIIGAAIGILVSGSVALAQGDGLRLSWSDTAYALAFGVFQVGLGLIFFVMGAKYLRAAEAMLLSLSEVVLGILWTWLIFSERPTEMGLLGGLVLLSAMVLQASSGMKRNRPPAGLI